MSGKRDSARNALRRAVPFLAERHHDDILNELDNESLLDGEPKNAENGGRVHAAVDSKRKYLLTPLQASAARQENVELVRRCRAACARYGYDLKDNELVSVPELDKALSKTEDLGARMNLKSQLYSLHLIPA